MIIKRDGTKVPFDKNKIINAINKAFIEVDGILYENDTAQDIAEEIDNYYYNNSGDLDIESIQDLVEEKLMKSERPDVAKAYILYREKRNQIRNSKSKIMQEVGKKLRAENVQNQNANVDEHSFGGRMGEASGVMSRDYALNFCVSEMARKNHEGNMIYIHDLDHYAVGDHNCLSIPFDDLLKNGFNTRQCDVRPAGSVNTAFQLVAVIFQLQSLQQFGGVSATHLDWTMVPYVRKSFVKHFKNGIKYLESADLVFQSDSPENIPVTDNRYKKYKNAYKYAIDMTEKEIHQAVEGLYHNLK